MASQEHGWPTADHEKGPARIPGLFKNEILTAMDLTAQFETAVLNKSDELINRGVLRPSTN
jgi:hypothetical protein